MTFLFLPFLQEAGRRLNLSSFRLCCSSPWLGRSVALFKNTQLHEQTVTVAAGNFLSSLLEGLLPSLGARCQHHGAVMVKPLYDGCIAALLHRPV